MEFPKLETSSPEVKQREFKIFIDDTVAAHRRRASWSPDGLFVVIPGGLYQQSQTAKPVYSTNVFARRHLAKPFAVLPCGKQPSIAVRFCPVLFKLAASDGQGKFVLPMRSMVDGGKDAAGERPLPTPEKLFQSPAKQGNTDTSASPFNLPYRLPRIRPAKF
eukprot:661871-Hanusia_phi.AAC.5